MFPMFFGICPVCEVPHDEGSFITLKDKREPVYLCLSCLDKMEYYEKDNSCSISDFTLPEIKDIVCGNMNKI